MKVNLWVVILLFILYMLYIAGPVSADDELKTQYQQERKRVDRIYKKIEERKKALSRLTEKERMVLSALEKIENRIDRQNVRIEDLTSVLEQKKQALVQTEGELAKIEDEVSHLKEQAKNRLISYYKFGSIGLMNIVFSSYSISDWFARQEALRYMLRKDRELISTFRSKTNRLSRMRQDIIASSQALGQLKEKIETEAHHLEQLRQEKADLLAALYQEKKEHLYKIKELHQAAEKLNTTIRALQRKMEKDAQPESGPQLSVGFAAQKGKLSPPVKGRVVGLFGQVRHSSSGATIIRKGIDIQAPSGTEIRSIYTGRVIYLGNLKGYGNLIILDHGDKYYSLYAHISKSFKEVGNLVKKGEVIGLTDAFGSLLGKCLYFEIRHGGEPENPLYWLDISKLILD